MPQLYKTGQIAAFRGEEQPNKVVGNTIALLFSDADFFFSQRERERRERE
jgi:hypothetical protein